MTQRALIAYSVGLIGLIVVKVLAPGFYSRQDIKTPVKIAIVTLIMTQLMNLAFIGPLKHAGLSLSIGLAACLNASLLYWQLRKQNIFTPQPGWMWFLARLIISVLVMAAVLFGVLHIMPEWSPRVDVMAFAAFDGGSDRGYRGLFRRACRAGL
ncbi:virulence factor MviN [Salmonella enterica subsp. arizonae]|uniref:Virulence factor MviN n=1 Tax=Salmonella enterica subsp. arizonae TaxID=59203 RepID=A0A379SL50_SALER|nr:virulence factor MviN [Salmonella enterica subsp. arizonae]